jgi:hypothetical protein
MPKTKKATATQIAEAYDLYINTKTERLKLEKAAKALKATENEAAELLQLTVPENDELHGVYHKAYDKPTVLYKDYADYLLSLLPKAKREAASQSRETDYTKTTRVHSFKGNS